MAKTNLFNSHQYTVFLAENALYGYKDQSGKIRIAPTFKSAQSFNKTGYAVVENSQGFYGIIDQQGLFIEPCKYQGIELYQVGRYTLANLVYTFGVKNRFWLWDYFPNITKENVLEVLPLFERLKTRACSSVKILSTNQVLLSHVVSLHGPWQNQGFIKIQVIGQRFVDIQGSLYKTRSNNKGLKKIINNYIGFCDNKSIIVGKISNHKARTYNTRGKRIHNYEILPQGAFTITYKGKEHMVCIDASKSNLEQKPTIYRDTKNYGFYYVNAKFELHLPIHLTEVDIKDPSCIVEIWQNITNVMPLVEKELFIIEVISWDVTSVNYLYFSLSKNGVLKDYDYTLGLPSSIEDHPLESFKVVG